jgi:hypothetical protein
MLLRQQTYDITTESCWTRDHATLNFNNNMSMAAVFLDIQKAFDITWHSGIIHKLLELEFSTTCIKLIASFLTERKFEVLMDGKFFLPWKIAAGVPQGSVIAPILYSLYINDAPAAPGTHVALFPDETCIYVTNMNVMFSANYNADSLQWIRGVSAAK